MLAGNLLTVARLKALMIKFRAEHVETGLKKAYAPENPDSFNVFCVDNKSYKMAASKGDKAIEAVHESGIPVLRRFFHKISAQTQLLELRSMVSRLEEVVNSIQLWKDPTRRDSSHEEFEQSLKQAKKLLVRVFQTQLLLFANNCRAIV
jgi:hypothetical protein